MTGMGRTRKHNRHLPGRLYQPPRSRSYYFIDATGKWHNMGRDYATALRQLAARIDSPTNTLKGLSLRYLAEEAAGKSAKTLKGRIQEFKKLMMVFGDVDPETIQPHHVWTYFTGRGKTEQARHEIRALSALLTFARRIGARSGPNPCFDLQLPGSAPRSRYVTDSEYLIVRGVAQPMIAYAMDLALLLGADQGTVRKLERRNLLEDGIQFERSKTKRKEKGERPHVIRWNEDLRATVKEVLALRPQLRQHLICNRKGKPYSPNGFQSQWQRTMNKALNCGLTESFHFHDLRAKSASDAESDQEAQARLNHADPRTTRDVYRRLPTVGNALPATPKPQNIRTLENT